MARRPPFAIFDIVLDRMRLEKPGISSRFLPAFAIFAEDRRQFGNLCVQARTIALTFYDLCLQYFESQRRHDGIQKTDTGRNRGAHGRRKQRGKLGCHRSRTRLHPGPTFGLSARRTRTDRAGSTAAPLCPVSTLIFPFKACIRSSLA